MTRNDDQYTFELRKISYKDHFIIMKRGGVAHQFYISELKNALEKKFGVESERVRTLYDLAISGCAMRYYAEEGKVIVLFDSEKWHIDSR